MEPLGQTIEIGCAAAKYSGGARRPLLKRWLLTLRYSSAGWILLVALAAVSTSSTARAQSPGDPTSSRAARDEATRAIPWQQLGPEQ
jgi:hypothetical protein